MDNKKVSDDLIFARPGQLLHAHAQNVSELAAQFGSKCGLAETERISGRLHDKGKEAQEFQDYMFSKNPKRGKVPHSIFGAKRIQNRLSAANPQVEMLAEMISNSIASHHGKLYDYLSPEGSTPFLDKLAETHDLQTTMDDEALDIDLLTTEMNHLLSVLSGSDMRFGLSMVNKFIYSCLVDADRLDAYLFESSQRYSPETQDWTNLQQRLEKRLASLDVSSEMTALRQYVSNSCMKAGKRKKGIYKLEVPTGGGKTLSSLRFALEHARIHELDRIIYIVPYLTILSQTANEIRLALGDEDTDGKRQALKDDTLILEHHSNFLPDEPENYKYHTDRWDVPIILTTQVQFLESIFSSRGSDLRKLHNMSRSVLIFDEAQSVPIKCTHLFNGAVDFLHRVCGSTILLCTATQPAFDRVKRKITFSENHSLVDCVAPPERYRIINKTRPGGYTYQELAEFVLNQHVNATLVIVNTKAAAKHLFNELKRSGTTVMHLSANMCSAHREVDIKELKECLDKKSPIICVSTQLIEAGVDISFECVIRDIAGWDSILQAAGRCNRHGECCEVKNVYVVNIKDENLDRLPDIKSGAETTHRLFADGNMDINTYYTYYYYDREEIMDYPIGDNRSIYDLLSQNRYSQGVFKSRKDKRGGAIPALRMAIRSASDEFFVIERGGVDVVVPYGDSEDILAQYIASDDLIIKRKLLRNLGKYSVTLYSYQITELDKCNAISDKGGILVLDRGFYDEERGVDLEGSHEFLCV